MYYVLLAMCLIFIAIAFLITKNNAKYLLAGYNTMEKEDQKKVDLTVYIPFIRKFHIFLGVSLFLIGTVLTYYNERAGAIFLVSYPILAYLYFIWRSLRFLGGGLK